MKIFLVRHGEGENSRIKWQTPTTPLSEKGKKQAQVLGNIPRFRDVDQILSSPWARSTRDSKYNFSEFKQTTFGSR